jgi:predicted permease
MLFGLAPAVHATRPDVAPTLKDQAGPVLGGAPRLRKALVASQVAISLLMLIGAGLFLRTLHNLLAVDVGFETRSLVSFAVDPSLNGYTPEATKQFAKRMLERLRSAPGIADASLTTVKLLDGNNWTTDITIAGYAAGEEEDMEQRCALVGPGYFRAMGIPVIRGREFDERDERNAPPAGSPGEDGPPYRVAVVNERFARQYFGDQDPIGRRFGFGTNPGRPTPIEIVGVVGDSKYSDLREQVPRQLFFPYLQERTPSGFTAYVRTTRPSEAAFAAARDVIRQLDPNLPIAATRTLEQQVNGALRRERLMASLSAVFGLLATLLAVVGLYGVMAYTVSRRTREIGVRIALGADGRDIRWMVLRESLVVTGVGIVLAAPFAWGLTRLVASQLYGVAALDPLTAAGAVALLTVVCLLAALLPSSRAARVQPTSALRYE